jgi:hypothetical protein
MYLWTRYRDIYEFIKEKSKNEEWFYSRKDYSERTS